jgi:hypothetical protein
MLPWSDFFSFQQFVINKKFFWSIRVCRLGIYHSPEMLRNFYHCQNRGVIVQRLDEKCLI